VVVGVLEARLYRVVVYIRDGAQGFNLVDAERLELKVRHGARRVLRQRLVDADCDFLACRHTPRYQVLFDYFPR